MQRLIGHALWILPLLGVVGGVSLLPRVLGSVLDSEIPTAVVK